MTKWIIGAVTAALAVLIVTLYIFVFTSDEGDYTCSPKVEVVVEVVRHKKGRCNSYGDCSSEKVEPDNKPLLLKKMEGAAFVTRCWDVVKAPTLPVAKKKKNGKKKKKKSDESDDSDESENFDVIRAGKIQVLPPSDEETGDWQLYYLDGEFDPETKMVKNEIVKGNIFQSRNDDEENDEGLFHQRLMTLLHLQVHKPAKYEERQKLNLEELRAAQQESFWDRIVSDF